MAWGQRRRPLKWTRIKDDEDDVELSREHAPRFAAPLNPADPRGRDGGSTTNFLAGESIFANPNHPDVRWPYENIPLALGLRVTAEGRIVERHSQWQVARPPQHSRRVTFENKTAIVLEREVSIDLWNEPFPGLQWMRLGESGNVKSWLWQPYEEVQPGGLIRLQIWDFNDPACMTPELFNHTRWPPITASICGLQAHQGFPTLVAVEAQNKWGVLFRGVQHPTKRPTCRDLLEKGQRCNCIHCRFDEINPDDLWFGVLHYRCVAWVLLDENLDRVTILDSADSPLLQENWMPELPTRSYTPAPVEPGTSSVEISYMESESQEPEPTPPIQHPAPVPARRPRRWEQVDEGFTLVHYPYLDALNMINGGGSLRAIEPELLAAFFIFLATIDYDIIVNADDAGNGGQRMSAQYTELVRTTNNVLGLLGMTFWVMGSPQDLILATKYGVLMRWRDQMRIARAERGHKYDRVVRRALLTLEIQRLFIQSWASMPDAETFRDVKDIVQQRVSERFPEMSHKTITDNAIPLIERDPADQIQASTLRWVVHDKADTQEAQEDDRRANELRRESEWYHPAAGAVSEKIKTYLQSGLQMPAWQMDLARYNEVPGLNPDGSWKRYQWVQALRTKEWIPIDVNLHFKKLFFCSNWNGRKNAALTCRPARTYEGGCSMLHFCSWCECEGASEWFTICTNMWGTCCTDRMNCPGAMSHFLGMINDPRPPELRPRPAGHYRSQRELRTLYYNGQL